MGKAILGAIVIVVALFVFTKVWGQELYGEVSHDLPYDQSNCSATAMSGTGFSTGNFNLSLTGADFYVGTSTQPSVAYLYNTTSSFDGVGDLIATTSISGGHATFSEESLDPNSYYYLLFDHSGGNYCVEFLADGYDADDLPIDWGFIAFENVTPDQGVTHVTTHQRNIETIEFYSSNFSESFITHSYVTFPSDGGIVSTTSFDVNWSVIKQIDTYDYTGICIASARTPYNEQCNVYPLTNTASLQTFSSPFVGEIGEQYVARAYVDDVNTQALDVRYSDRVAFYVVSTPELYGHELDFTSTSEDSIFAKCGNITDDGGTALKDTLVRNFYAATCRFMVVMFDPATIGSAGLQGSLDEMREVFPVSLVMDVTETLEEQASTTPAALTLNLPVYIGTSSTFSVTLLSSTSLSDIVGTETRDTLFTILGSIIWLLVGVAVIKLL